MDTGSRSEGIRRWLDGLPAGLAQRRVRVFCLVLAGVVVAACVAIAALLTFDPVAAAVSTGLVVAVAGLVWILGSRHSARIDRLVAQLPAGPFSGPAS